MSDTETEARLHREMLYSVLSAKEAENRALRAEVERLQRELALARDERVE